MRCKIDPSDLAFDIDGVLADTMSLFIDIAARDFGIHHIRYEDITDYELEGLGGMDGQMISEIGRRLVNGDHVRLEAFDGAIDVLRRLNRHHSPTLFVTARPSADMIHDWILDRLTVGQEDIDVIATGSFDDKLDVLLEKGVGYFVEDRLETCFLIAEAGISPILFKQPWNRRPHPFIEVTHWRELEELILL